jgi:hypothetical protein
MARAQNWQAELKIYISADLFSVRDNGPGSQSGN